MIISPNSISYRARLVAELQQAGAIHSFAVANAFATIPREPFVSLFYKPEGREWLPYSEETHGEGWLSLIYQDAALVTLLNEQKIPISSSSMPSLIAQCWKLWMFNWVCMSWRSEPALAITPVFSRN